MNFNRQMIVQLSGQEVAVVIAGLGELPTKIAHELLNKLEAIDAAMTAEESKMPVPPLKLVSQAVRESLQKDAPAT